MFWNFRFKGGLAYMLWQTGSYKSLRQAVRFVRAGFVGEMKALNEECIARVTDPNYIPKVGQVFGEYDGMFGTEKWFKMTADGLVRVSSNT